jgi:hypothetical protein
MCPVRRSHPSRVSLKPPRSVSALLVMADAVIAAMTDNPTFPDAGPALKELTASVATLGKAQTATLSRTRGTVETRNAALNALRPVFDYLKAYVQTIADANPEKAVWVIESAGMSVHKSTAHPGPSFTVKQGALSGTVDLTAPRTAKRAFYEWQNSLDGCKTWTSLPSTLKAKTTITGLPLAATVWFRCRSVTKKGAGDWTNPVSIVVN